VQPPPTTKSQVAPAAAGVARTAVTTTARDGEGVIAVTMRVCGSAPNWRTVAAANGIRGPLYLVRLGQRIVVTCAGTPRPAATTSDTWANPLPGTCRPTGGGGQFGAPRPHGSHQGIDLGSPNTRRSGSNIYPGVPVRAVRDGTVSYVGWSGTAGLQVQIRHGGGWLSKYNHLSAERVYNGQSVGAGQQIGNMGATGNATRWVNGVKVVSPHLHVELWRGGRPHDPRLILPVRC
jgi:murein DD-endopeptidase MepM/ murein hydrolase activator NlpD